MKILVTNDDGIHSVGIRMLADALKEQGHEVSVFAPASQKSACSQSLSVHSDFTVKELEWEGMNRVVAVDGTPSDCVKFALKYVGIKPDLVVSGPNEGSNLGTDVMYSGTVAGAMEGVICGYKAIAISQCGKSHISPERLIRFFINNFDTLLRFEKQGSMLNVNFPDTEEVLGVKIAKTGIISYRDYYEVRETDGVRSYRLKGSPVLKEEDDEDCDVKFAQRGYITVSPIKMDRTDYDELERMTGAERLFGTEDL